MDTENFPLLFFNFRVPEPKKPKVFKAQATLVSRLLDTAVAVVSSFQVEVCSVHARMSLRL